MCIWGAGSHAPPITVLSVTVIGKRPIQFRTYISIVRNNDSSNKFGKNI